MYRVEGGSYLNDAEYIKRQMDNLAKRLEAGEIDDKDYDEEMQILIERKNKRK